MLDIDAGGVITDIDPTTAWHRQWEATRQAEREATARAARERREEVRRLRVDVETGLQLMRASTTAAAGRKKVGESIARQHNTTIRGSLSIPPGISAYAEVRTRTIVVPPDWYDSDAGLAEFLHEQGHVICGECPRTEPHRQNPAVRAWAHCLACERHAWAMALQIVPVFTPAMFTRLQQGLAAYRGSTPAPAAAVVAADRLMSTLTYDDHLQARVMRETRLAWLRNVICETERERSTRR